MLNEESIQSEIKNALTLKQDLKTQWQQRDDALDAKTYVQEVTAAIALRQKHIGIMDETIGRFVADFYREAEDASIENHEINPYVYFDKRTHRRPDQTPRSGVPRCLTASPTTYSKK